MTTNPTHIPEPTSLNSVVVGKRNGENVVAVRADDDSVPWMLRLEPGYFDWQEWTDLCRKLTDIRVVDVDEVVAEINQLKAHIAALETAAIYSVGVHQGEMASQRARFGARIAELEAAKPCECRWCVAAQRRDRMQVGGMVIAPCDEYGRTDREAAKPEPGPWLRGDELAAIMPTLKAGDVVEVEHMGHPARGPLWMDSFAILSLWTATVRNPNGIPGSWVDALRIIERSPEPEPGADIPDEVVKTAHRAYWDHYAEASSVGPNGDTTAVRLALAAADAKRAELAGGEQA